MQLNSYVNCKQRMILNPKILFHKEMLNVNFIFKRANKFIEQQILRGKNKAYKKYSTYHSYWIAGSSAENDNPSELTKIWSAATNVKINVE